MSKPRKDMLYLDLIKKVHQFKCSIYFCYETIKLHQRSHHSLIFNILSLIFNSFFPYHFSNLLFFNFSHPFYLFISLLLSTLISLFLYLFILLLFFSLFSSPYYKFTIFFFFDSIHSFSTHKMLFLSLIFFPFWWILKLFFLHLYFTLINF